MSAREPSWEEKAAAEVNQLEFDIGEMKDRIEQIVTDAIGAETRRCLAWLAAGVPLEEAIDHMRHYEDPPAEAVAIVEAADG